MDKKTLYQFLNSLPDAEDVKIYDGENLVCGIYRPDCSPGEVSMMLEKPLEKPLENALDFTWKGWEFPH